MIFIKRLEDKIADIMKLTPRLPLSVPKRLAQKMWIVAIVMGVYCGLSAFVHFVTFGMFNSLILFGLITQAILLSLAAKPLRAMQRGGWDMLFLSVLVFAVIAIIESIATFNVFSFVFSMVYKFIVVALFLYVIFQVRGEFMQLVRTTGAKKKR